MMTDILTNARLGMHRRRGSFDREIEHLDGHRVTVASAGTTQHGDVRRVHGEGMPEHNFASNK
jgi:DnaJ homolog subfamily B member 11